MRKVVDMTMEKIRRDSDINQEIRGIEIRGGIYSRFYEELEKRLKQGGITKEDRGQVEYIKENLGELIEKEKMRKETLMERRKDVESSLKNVINNTHGGQI